MNSDCPLVSVLMTAYNREQFIGEAIESVLNSSYTNLEIIIVDDCSKDKTCEIARDYQKSDSRIRIYRNSYNLGDYPNRNRAALLARGKYLMYVDSDDQLFERTLEDWITAMEGHDANFGIYFPEDGVTEPYCIEPAEAIFRQYFKGAFLQVGPGGIILNRNYFSQIGMFPEKYGPANDMYFNVKAVSKTKTLIFPYPSVKYRRHDGQQLNNQYAYMYNNYRYNRDLIKELDLPLTPQQKSYILKKNKRRFAVNTIQYFIQTGNLKETARLYKHADFSVRDFIPGIFH